MIVLPTGAMIAQKVKEKTKIIGLEKENQGKAVIMFTCKNLKEYQFCEVVYREDFVEDIKDIAGHKDLIFIRDFNSIYYIRTIDDKE